MAYTPITTGEIVEGHAVSHITQNKIKDNFDDHETRLQTTLAALTAFPPIILAVNGTYFVKDGVMKTMIGGNYKITGARILVDVAGMGEDSGGLAIDILRKRGGGSYASIFSGDLEIHYSAGNDSISVNANLDPTMVFLEDEDILRLDIKSIQYEARNFMVRLDYELYEP